MRRITLRIRLFGIAAVGVLMVVLVGTVGLSGYARLTAANQAEVRLGSTQALALQLLAIQHKVRAQAWFAVAQSAGGTGRPPTEIRSEFTEARTEMQQASLRIADLAAGTGYEQRIDQLIQDQQQVITHADSVIALSLSDRPAALAAVSVLESEADTLDIEVSKLTDQLDADRQRHLAEANGIERSDSVWLFAAVLVAALLGVVLSIRSARQILRNLTTIGETARRIGAGDLTARAVVPGRDEISALARSFNDTAAQLSATMDRLTAEARREKLSGQLADAFDMAEAESDAYTVIGKALTMLDPQRPAELLLADNSQAHLTVRAQSGPGAAPCCPVTSPFDCVAVRRGHAVTFLDSDSLDTCPKLTGRPEGRLSAVCVPVTFMGRSLGVLHSTGPAGERCEPDVQVGLGMIAAQAGNRIGTLRSFELAQLQASTDALTGLPNRRAFETAAHERLKRGGRLTVVMADLDRFKLLNDTFGHEAGDRALRLFGRVARGSLRPHDLIGRWGGEEFCLILDDVAPEEAVRVLDRLRGALKMAIDAATPAFTASFGACWTDGHIPFDDLLRTADQALYQAKSDGRDRVVLAGHQDRRQAAAEAAAPAVSSA